MALSNMEYQNLLDILQKSQDCIGIIYSEVVKSHNMDGELVENVLQSIHYLQEVCNNITDNMDLNNRGITL